MPGFEPGTSNYEERRVENGEVYVCGGIHPYDGKELSKDKPIKEVLPKGDLVYPLSQHIGAPAVPVVQKGDRVLAGQKIAEANGFVSASVFASVSGTVKAIEPRRVVTGDNVMSIVVENDGAYEEVQFPPVKPLEKMSRDEIIGLIRRRVSWEWGERDSQPM